jgi:hypothetical protein
VYVEPVALSTGVWQVITCWVGRAAFMPLSASVVELYGSIRVHPMKQWLSTMRRSPMRVLKAMLVKVA